MTCRATTNIQRGVMKRFFTLCFILFFAVGCGNRNVQLSGTVTFEDDTPLTIGAVVFSTDTFMASGNIGSNGKYLMGSYGMKDGLPPGTYKVYIAGATEEVSEKNGGVWSLIDPKFGGYTSTPITCEIPAPQNTFNITVPRNPTPKPK